MIFVFYNKFLLRALVFLAGAGIGLCAWKYVALSVEKLPQQGARDALAIVSFLIAGWLVMLIAEVADNHYVRTFACLCVGLGGYVSYRWIFSVDGPKLLELPDGPAGMALVRLGFFSAMAIAVLLLGILVARLVMDKLNYGRPAFAPASAPASLGAAPPVQPLPSSAGELPPIPLDKSPLVTGSAPVAQVFVAPPQAREIGPVKKLAGIGGIYLGQSFDLAPGEYSIGRADATILLSEDNQVSRRHALITVGPDGIAELNDQGSTNGTFLNNDRIDRAKLAPGDVIRLGTSLFKVEA
jgi:hypothetical protein